MSMRGLSSRGAKADYAAPPLRLSATLLRPVCDRKHVRRTQPRECRLHRSVPTASARHRSTSRPSEWPRSCAFPDRRRMSAGDPRWLPRSRPIRAHGRCARFLRSDCAPGARPEYGENPRETGRSPAGVPTRHPGQSRKPCAAVRDRSHEDAGNRRGYPQSSSACRSRRCRPPWLEDRVCRTEPDR